MLEPPRPISADDDPSFFDCNKPVLDAWLKRRAIQNEPLGASRTYVVCDAGRIVAYYCLANGAVAHVAAPGRVRRNMPDPIPAMVIGRLAVDRRLQGQGVGRALLRDAIFRTLRAGTIAGIRAIVVHALDEHAARFYARCGFLISPVDPLILMLPMETAGKALEDSPP